MTRQAELVQARTKQFAIDILKQFSQVPKTLEIEAIEPPLIKAVTGLAARCHSIGRLPSDADPSIALSAAAAEADEARFWLELLDATGAWDAQIMGRLMQDASDIAALLASDGETPSSEPTAVVLDKESEPAQPESTPTGFAGLRVIAFESRMAAQMTRLIERHNGKALVVPALREIPIPSQENAAVFRFGARLMMDQVDMLILLTGVGTRGLLDLLLQRYPAESLVEAFSKIVIVSRGPKPAAALKSIGLTPNISVPEPNTWYDLLATLDEYRPVKGQRVVVQEYGLPNADLIEALKQRGADVFAVPIYRWALPEDVQPLQQAVTEIVSGAVDVMLITNAVQVDHVMQIAEQAGQAALLKEASQHMVVAAIGPTASERLRSHDLPVDLEPSHPKMGILVKETADRAASILKGKKNPSHPLSS